MTDSGDTKDWNHRRLHKMPLRFLWWKFHTFQTTVYIDNFSVLPFQRMKSMEATIVKANIININTSKRATEFPGWTKTTSNWLCSNAKPPRYPNWDFYGVAFWPSPLEWWRRPTISWSNKREPISGNCSPCGASCKPPSCSVSPDIKARIIVEV